MEQSLLFFTFYAVQPMLYGWGCNTVLYLHVQFYVEQLTEHFFHHECIGVS
jgi:hypothetical protein